MIKTFQIDEMAARMAETDPGVRHYKNLVEMCIHRNKLERAAKLKVKQNRLAKLKALDGSIAEIPPTWRNLERPKRSLIPLQRNLAKRMEYVRMVAVARLTLDLQRL